MAKTESRIREFKPTSMQQRFLTDVHRKVIAFMSAVNQGKSSSLPTKAMYAARLQHPDRDGVRHTSFVFLRGTQSQILDTLIPTIYEWIPQQLWDKGGIRESPPIRGTISRMPCNDQDDYFPQHMTTTDLFGQKTQQPYLIGAEKNPETGLYEGGMDVSGKRIGDVFPGGTTINTRWRFIGIDNPTWLADLRSTQFGSAFIEEADQIEVLPDMLPELQTRLNRFPSADVAPCTVAQVSMAYNPVPYGHFLQEYFAKDMDDRKLYRMPPPIIKIDHPDFPDDFQHCEFKVNPSAEGLHFAHTGAAYWLDLAETNRHKPDYVTRMMLGDYTRPGGAGERVFKGFNYQKHVKEIKPLRHLRIMVGLDHANTPAAVFAQWDGGLRIFHEMYEDEMLSYKFIRDELIPYIRSNYPNYDFVFTGDPTGETERDMGGSPFQMLRDAGFETETDVSNIIQQRLDAVDYYLGQEGGFSVDPACERLITGYNGGYQIDKDAKKRNIHRPLKRGIDALKYTHVQDCVQAIALLVKGGIEHRSTLPQADYHSSELKEQQRTRSNYLFV